MSLIVGVDVGGTFTDVVAYDGRAIAGRKVPTTAEQSVAVVEALRDLGADATSVFLHGTTAGTNALLEGRGARTALVTSPGFEDVIEIGRQARPSLYDSFVDRPPSLVPRDQRLALGEDPGQVLEALRRLGPESVAVALVRSFQDPAGELEFADLVADELSVPVSVAARVSPAFREYERVATTVLNAYLTPEVSGYLERLDEVSGAGRRLVMTSSGGLLPFAAASAHAGRLVLSGPAAGVVAAAELGRVKGRDSVISFDMGGTSTDVCRITGAAATGGWRQSGGERVNRVPTMPIRTIGAGGGSLAWVDDGGALRVGPRSAGSVPGPAAYGRGGTEATVTDANLVLGRIPGSLEMGGSVRLEADLALRAISAIGELFGLDPAGAASGIVEVADAHMERALRMVSVEEGSDPRRSAMVAFGGAGGLHAGGLARRLGMRSVLVPPLSGVFSALGLLLARPASDAARTVMLDESSSGLDTAHAEIRAQAESAFAEAHGATAEETRVFGEVRYRGQAHELSVPLPLHWDELRDRFETEHAARFGFARPGQPIELVDVRAVATGRAPITWTDLPPITASAPPKPDRTEDAGTSVWKRRDLPAGFEVRGPGVIVEADSAIWLDPDDRMAVDDDGTLLIEV